MVRSELVRAMGDECSHLPRIELAKVVTVVFDEIVIALAAGRRVELRGFGAFTTRSRDAHIGRNPHTGDDVNVDVKMIVHFKLGKDLRERLNLKPAAR